MMILEMSRAGLSTSDLLSRRSSRNAEECSSVLFIVIPCLILVLLVRCVRVSSMVSCIAAIATRIVMVVAVEIVVDYCA